MDEQPSSQPQRAPWQQYLDDVIRHMTAAEKQRVYTAVGLSRTSFQRWRNGENLPEASHIPPLLDTLPAEKRAHMIELMLEDPRVRVLLPDEIVNPRTPSLADGIEPAFYAEMLRAQRESMERLWEMSAFIFGHALKALETSGQPIGLHMHLARCMPPQADGKIRSLRGEIAIGSYPWDIHLHRDQIFFGDESAAGEAVMQRHEVMYPERRASGPASKIREQGQSQAAYPIMHQKGIAGALIVTSREPYFFTPDRLTRLQHYADLLRLAFYDDELVPSGQISLAIMPSWQTQQPILARMEKRVEEQYRQTVAKAKVFQSLDETREQVWQAVEIEFMHLALDEAAQFPEQPSDVPDAQEE